METAVDHATDRTLTEGANAHGIGEGNIRPCDKCRRQEDASQWVEHVDACPNWNHPYPCAHNALIDEYQRSNRRVYVATTEGWDDVDHQVARRDKAWDKLVASQQAHDDYVARRQREQAHKRNAEKLHKGAWAFTLTYSPAKHGWGKEEAQSAMREAIRRLRHYYRHEIEEFEAVGEWTQAGLPHVHGWYRLTAGKRMTTKNFKRAFPIWNPNHRMGKGHEGGYHEPAKSDSDYAGYIQKDLDDAWLVESTTTNAVQACVSEAQDDEAEA